LYVTFRKELDPDPDTNLKQIPRRQRAMVRKGIKAGLVGQLDDTTDRFYPLYAESVRNLGTPVFSRRLFDALREQFGRQCEILTIEHEGRPISSVMSFYFRDEVLPYYGGGSFEARGVAANDFMYWDLMRRACERGVKVFDYGRSKRDTGSFRFKKHWGFEPEPLHYECLLVKAREIPEVNPLNPKYAFFIRTWKKLPVGVANALGPWLSKNLG
jgi:FemAB-related protein (PEP-CTERM system-associated)